MKIAKRAAITLALSLLLTLNPLRVAAERFCDLYAGESLSMDEDLTISTPRGQASQEADFGISFTAGYRLGYWFNSHPWAGIAMEASMFQQDIDNGKLEVFPVSALLMFRLPLFRSRVYPKGELLPYVGTGPGVFFSHIDYEVAHSAIPGLLQKSVSGTYSDHSIDPGLDVRMGIAKQLPRNIALFAEYRYTWIKPDFKEDILGADVKMETELNTHHLLIGFSYFF